MLLAGHNYPTPDNHDYNYTVPNNHTGLLCKLYLPRWNGEKAESPRHLLPKHSSLQLSRQRPMLPASHNYPIPDNHDYNYTISDNYTGHLCKLHLPHGHGEEAKSPRHLLPGRSSLQISRQQSMLPAAHNYPLPDYNDCPGNNHHDPQPYNDPMPYHDPHPHNNPGNNYLDPQPHNDPMSYLNPMPYHDSLRY